MTTTLASLGIDLTAHSSVSADILLAGKLTALYEYAKSLEERSSGSRIAALEREIAGLRVKIDEIADAADSVQDWSGTYLGDCLESAKTYLPT